MATIVSTPASPTANSYASLEDAAAYHDTHPYAATWDDADEDQKVRALITATRMLDTWFDWNGDISTLDQRLLWPRRGVLRPGISPAMQDIRRNDWHQPFGVLLSAETVPTIVVEATSELARQLLDSNRTADSDVETQGLRSLKAGPVDLTFSASSVAKPIPDAVMVMASQLGRYKGRDGGAAVDLQRG